MRRFPIFVLKLLLAGLVLAGVGCASYAARFPEPGVWNAAHDQYLSERAMQFQGQRFGLGPVVAAAQVAPGVYSTGNAPRLTQYQADTAVHEEFEVGRVDRVEFYHGVWMATGLSLDGFTTLVCMRKGWLEANPFFPKHLSPAVPLLLPIIPTAVYFKAASTTPLSDSLTKLTTFNAVEHTLAGLYNLRCF